MTSRTVRLRRDTGPCRLALAFAVVAAGVMLDAGVPARAEGPWCASLTGPDGGTVVCNHATWDQCVTTVRGIGGICHRNPDPAFGIARPNRARRG